MAQQERAAARASLGPAELARRELDAQRSAQEADRLVQEELWILDRSNRRTG